MKAASLVLLCGMLLIMGLPAKAEERGVHALGSWGSSSHRRSLLQLAAMMVAENTAFMEMENADSEPPPRDSPDERGQGAKYEPKGDTLPPSYHGPTTNSASGTLAASDGLTTGYPKDGVSCAIPAASASQKPYDTKRPYNHTFPGGYTLLFVPFYSADYTGYHWAIYDNNNKFYSFDDGDGSTGDYDYDDSDGLPAGCQYLDWQPSDTLSSSAALSALRPGLAASGANVSVFRSAPAIGPSSAVGGTAAPVQSPAAAAHTSKGAHTSATPSSYIAPAPAPARSPRNATLELAKQAALQSGMSLGREGLVKLLCRPIGAKRDPPSHMSKAVKLGLGLGLGIPAAVFLMLVCVGAYLDK